MTLNNERDTRNSNSKQSEPSKVDTFLWSYLSTKEISTIMNRIAIGTNIRIIFSFAIYSRNLKYL